MMVFYPKDAGQGCSGGGYEFLQVGDESFNIKTGDPLPDLLGVKGSPLKTFQRSNQ